MGILDRLGLRKQRQSDVQPSGTPRAEGLSKDNPIKLAPPDDPAQVRLMRDKLRALIAEKKGLGSDAARRLDTEFLDIALANIAEKTFLEYAFGEEGVKWTRGARNSWTDIGIHSQAIHVRDGREMTLFFDHSPYRSLRTRVP